MQSRLWTKQNRNFKTQVLFAKMGTQIHLKDHKGVIAETDYILSHNQYDDRSFVFAYLNGVAHTYSEQYMLQSTSTIKALKSFRTMLSLTSSNTLFSHKQHAIVLWFVSVCLLYIIRPEQALGLLFEALEIYDKLNSSIQTKASCYGIISKCYSMMGKKVQAKHYENLLHDKLYGKAWIPNKYLHSLFMCVFMH